MKKYILIALSLLVLIATGCTSVEKKTSLVKVERIGDIDNKYGEIVIRDGKIINPVEGFKTPTLKSDINKLTNRKKDIEINSMEYEDEIVKMNFVFTDDDIKLSIENKSDNIIKIDWDSSVYIDENALCWRVVNKDYKWKYYKERLGIKYMSFIKDVSNVQEMTIIEGKEIRNDYIIPKKNVVYVDGWNIQKLIKVEKGDIGILLAIEIDGEKYEYLSSFYHEQIEKEKADIETDEHSEFS